MNKTKQNHFYLFGGVKCENQKELCVRFNISSNQFRHMVKTGTITKHY